MSWARIDDGFDDHPKVVALLDADDQAAAGIAVGLWTLCLTWAHRNTRRRGKVPGLLPPGLPRRFLGPCGRDAAELLVKHELWEPQPDGGWLIHDFGDYLPTEETRAARSAAGKRGAATRWAEKHAADAAAHQAAKAVEVSAGADGNLPSGDSKVPSSGHDGDSKPVASDGSRAPARRVSTSSKGVIPEPTPEPDQPSAADASRSAATAGGGLSITQRSKRITDAYAEAEPMCKWPAVNGVVIRAIKAERWTDGEIESALLRMAKEGRSVTVDALRTELNGLTPRSRAPTHAPYRDPADQDEYDDWKGPNR